MPPVASGEARRLIAAGRRSRRSCRTTIASAVLALFASTACAPALGERAKRDDAARGTTVFTWTYEHDPARMIVWRFPASAVATYLRTGNARSVDGTVDEACRTATDAHALLLVVAPERSRARERALDCGVAIERDRFAVVIAPR